MAYITLNRENISTEHICCAFSDKKCAESYQSKKDWLAAEFEQGYVFRRLDERAKVFIEFGPAEQAWVPVTAPDYLMLGCFWVSGKYKGQGHGKALLAEVVKAAQQQGKKGVAAVVGSKKYHFMSDTKWLLRQGFRVTDTTPAGFSLLTLNFQGSGEADCFFNPAAKAGSCPGQTGLIAYYSNRCPFSEYHVRNSLYETAKNRSLPLKVIKIETLEEAKNCPSPATIFSLFLDGKFITTDISACMDSRFNTVSDSIRG